MVAFVFSANAVAWNMARHMLTGAFVYQELKQNKPDLLQEVLAILKEHPEYDTRWAGPLSRVAEDKQDQALLMLAARWPDDARDDPDEHHATWHYVSFPYGKGTWPNANRPKKAQIGHVTQQHAYHLSQQRGVMAQHIGFAATSFKPIKVLLVSGNASRIEAISIARPTVLRGRVHSRT